MSVFFFHKRSQIAIENRFLKCQRFLLPGSKPLTSAVDSLENGLGLNFKVWTENVFKPGPTSLQPFDITT